MYAVVESGGKQYKVAVGEVIDVESLPAAVGETVELDRVLMVAEGESVSVGHPTLENARVTARVVAHGRGRKVIAFRYMAKERLRRKKGHRQNYTRLRIEAINV